MKSLQIDWQHIEVDGRTCVRCAETGQTLSQVIEELKEQLKQSGVSIHLTETKLSPEKTAQSNKLFVNGKALEDVLDVAVSENPCASCTELCGCGDLCGTEVSCPTIISEGTVYEAIPAQLIRRAALKIAFPDAK